MTITWMKSSNNLWNSTLLKITRISFSIPSDRAEQAREKGKIPRESFRESERSFQESERRVKSVSREENSQLQIFPPSIGSLQFVTSRWKDWKKKRCRGIILCSDEGKSSDFLIKLKADKNYAKVRKFRNLWKSQKNRLKCEHTRGVEKLANVLNGLKHKNNNFEVWLIKQKFSNISLGSSAKLSLNEISEN